MNQTAHQNLYGPADLVELLAIDDPFFGVGRGEPHRLDDDLVIVGSERSLLQDYLRMVLGFVGVASQNALIERLR